MWAIRKRWTPNSSAGHKPTVNLPPFLAFHSWMVETWYQIALQNYLKWPIRKLSLCLFIHRETDFCNEIVWKVQQSIRREIVGWINFTIPGNLLVWNWKSASDPFISFPFSLTPFNIIIFTLFLLTSVHIAHFRIDLLNIAVAMLYVFWIEIPCVSFDRFHSLRHFLSNLAQPLFGRASLDLTQCGTEYLHDLYSVFVLPIVCISCKYTHMYVHTMELEFEFFLQNFALRLCIWHLLYLTAFQGRRRWRMGKSKSRDAQIAKGKNEIWQCRNLWQKSAEILAKT